jgi:hypothetical protein
MQLVWPVCVVLSCMEWLLCNAYELSLTPVFTVRYFKLFFEQHLGELVNLTYAHKAICSRV